jgi:hypothetical protein
MVECLLSKCEVLSSNDIHQKRKKRNKEKEERKLGVVVHACGPSHLGGGGRRITVRGQQKVSLSLYLKLNLKQKDWGHGSSSRT